MRAARAVLTKLVTPWEADKELMEIRNLLTAYPIVPSDESLEVCISPSQRDATTNFAHR